MNKKSNLTQGGSKPTSTDHCTTTSTAYQTVLVLQGGGALGAFQAGAYQALHEAGIEPDWVIGTSIGAINSSIIAGNPPEERVMRLAELWKRVEQRNLAPWLPTTMNNTLNDLSIFSGGVPGFFRPNPMAWLGQQSPVGIEKAAWYDTSPLRQTLSELIDPARLNTGTTRLTVGAVNARSGEMRYFDSRDEALSIDHIMASSALPPAFSAVRIDGEPYWDGGIYSNTPIEAVFQDNPRRSSLIFAVNLWPAAGPEPESITQILSRYKDIQYASRAHSHIAQQQQLHHLRHVIRSLDQHLPQSLRNSDEVKALTAYGCATIMHVMLLSPPRLEGETATKDIDFSTAGLRARHQAGYAKAREVIDSAPWTRAYDPIEGVIMHPPETSGYNQTDFTS